MGRHSVEEGVNRRSMGVISRHEGRLAKLQRQRAKMPSRRKATGWHAGDDRRFLARLEARLAAAVQRAGCQVTCRVGCMECCLGPFDITPLDALRLRQGLEELAQRDEQGAAAVMARASLQWTLLADDFPGDTATGILSDDADARLAFFSAHGDLPCPALHPTHGACELYHARPVSCRTFGLPIRCGGELLPPCPLNFTTATPDEVATAAVDPDPGDEEGKLLVRLGGGGDTLVAWVLMMGGLRATTFKWPGAEPVGSPR